MSRTPAKLSLNWARMQTPRTFGNIENPKRSNNTSVISLLSEEYIEDKLTTADLRPSKYGTKQSWGIQKIQPRISKIYRDSRFSRPILEHIFLWLLHSGSVENGKRRACFPENQLFSARFEHIFSELYSEPEFYSLSSRFSYFCLFIVWS